MVACGLKNPPAKSGDTGDMSLIPGSGRSSRGGNGNPHQYSCLENPWAEDLGRLQSMENAESDRTEHTGTHNIIPGTDPCL